MGFLFQSSAAYARDFCWRSNLRTRAPKLNDQSKAISTANPPNMKRLGSVVRNINVYAMSQQPNATMPGNMRLCGPDTAGEIKRRLTLAGSVAPTVEAARPFEVPCLALAMRDCEVLPLAGALLRFWAFGMAKTHLPGSDLPGADSPSSVALCWFASSW